MQFSRARCRFATTDATHRRGKTESFKSSAAAVARWESRQARPRTFQPPTGLSPGLAGGMHTQWAGEAWLGTSSRSACAHTIAAAAAARLFVCVCVCRRQPPTSSSRARRHPPAMSSINWRSNLRFLPSSQSTFLIANLERWTCYAHALILNPIIRFIYNFEKIFIIYILHIFRQGNIFFVFGFFEIKDGANARKTFFIHRSTITPLGMVAKFIFASSSHFFFLFYTYVML